MKFLTLLLIVSSSLAFSKTYTLDTSASRVDWKGSKKVGGEHFGTVSIIDGAVKVKDGLPVKGSFEIDMTSINPTDLEAGSKMHKKLTKHLKNEDFFMTNKFKTAKFVIKKSKKLKDKKVQITGDLTIKGKTKSVTFPATVEHSDSVVSAVAEFKIDRTRWGIKYGSNLVTKQLDRVINNEIDFKLNLFARQFPGQKGKMAVPVKKQAL